MNAGRGGEGGSANSSREMECVGRRERRGIGSREKWGGGRFNCVQDAGGECRGFYSCLFVCFGWMRRDMIVKRVGDS